MNLASALFGGTLRSEIAPDLCNATIDRAIFWFEPDATIETLRILARLPDRGAAAGRAKS